MTIQKNFLQWGQSIQKNFLASQDETQKNFLEPYAVNVLKNFIAGVGYFAEKAKEIEEDARKKFCDYPSA